MPEAVLFVLNELIDLLLRLPIVIIALVVHECAHGFIAYKLGDPTAKYLGRLTLNPIKHLDPIGALCMLLFRFGWAKPVPINPMYFKNPKVGMALSSLAGPTSNIILSFIGTFFYVLSVKLGNLIIVTTANTGLYTPLSYLYQFFAMFAILNMSLAIFNLIPLPPLDGSRIISIFLPQRAYFRIMRYERYIGIGFMVLLLVDSYFLGGYITGALSFIVNFVINDLFVPLFDLILFFI
ncbi:MAG: site-2 protease family protein [Ruminococcaceae bacterium]|nr:site-2 protease family protein [Oscillospiraceae bacterium]